MISEVTPDSLETVWASVLPQVEQGLNRGAGYTTSAAILLGRVRSGQSAMWVVHEGPDIQGCVILSVYQYPARKSLYVDMIAGRDMDPVVPEVERLLRDHKDLIGADMIEASCRIGLMKKLKSWKPRAVILELT